MTTVAATSVDYLDPATLGARGAALLQRDRWSHERLHEYQRERLRALVRHAVRYSPYYRDELGARAEDADLADLPTVSKRVLMERFDDVVSDPRLRLAELEPFLGHADAGALYLGEYRVFSTSGTTGMPGLFVYSQKEFAHWVAVFIRSFARLGLTAGDAHRRHRSAERAPSLAAGDRGHAGRPARRAHRLRDDADGRDDLGARPIPAGGDRRLPDRHRAARRGAAPRTSRDRATGGAHVVGGADRRRRRENRVRVDDAGAGVLLDRGRGDRRGLARPRRNACLRRGDRRGRRRSESVRCLPGRSGARCCSRTWSTAPSR